MRGSLSGVQLAERAKELRPEIKILLTSGFAKVAMENASGGRPAGPLLSKPYRMQDLAQAVSEALHGSGEEAQKGGSGGARQGTLADALQTGRAAWGERGVSDM